MTNHKNDYIEKEYKNIYVITYEDQLRLQQQSESLSINLKKHYS